EDPVPVGRGGAEVAEDDDEDEDVVDREGVLDQVAGGELEPGAVTGLAPGPQPEEGGEAYPDQHPERRLAAAHLVRAAVEDEEPTMQKLAQKLVASLIDLVCGIAILGVAFAGVRLLLSSPRLVYLLFPTLSAVALGFALWRGRRRVIPAWVTVALLTAPLLAL